MNQEDEKDVYCYCCGELLNAAEIKQGEETCFPCLKGNCDLCN